jgi:Zn-dependent protease with chaperone function
MNRTIITAIVALALGSASSGVAQDDRPPTHKAALATLQYFRSVLTADFDGLLRRLRPPPLPAAIRAKVIGTLPEEGELTATPREMLKLAAISTVLRYHQREDMTVRLINVGGVAFVGLYARTVLLISREALALLNAQEVMAITAHEVGHDYVWDPYEEARQRHDGAALQELDLHCDALSVITLDRLGVSPEGLVSAVRKLQQHNARRGHLDEFGYVPLDERIRLIRSVAHLVTTVPPEVRSLRASK